MAATRIVCESYFDGERHQADGPYTFVLAEHRIVGIHRGEPATDPTPTVRVPFLMPGLVEGHAHLFLDGDETDFEARSAHLKQPLESLLQTGRESLALNLAAGVTLVRDAGDKHGVNSWLKAESLASPDASPALLSAGIAVRKAKRYGSFMAREVSGLEDLDQTIREVAATADQLKILLTGIIDFETGRMKGEVQFDQTETNRIVALAKSLGLQTFCHCSGLEGLQIAVEAGIDCIEHGFFMTRDILAVMRDKHLAWVPTFRPVDFQWRYPAYCGWNEATCAELRRILDNHEEQLCLAYDLGVPVIAGSDAGSYGSPHGRALIEDLVLMRAAGAPVAGILASATSVPRRRWEVGPAILRPGAEADLLGLADSPFADFEAVRQPVALYHRGRRITPGDVGRPGAAARTVSASAV